MGDFEGALDDIEEALRLTPVSQAFEKISLHDMKGMIYHKLGDFIACEKEFRVFLIDQS